MVDLLCQDYMCDCHKVSIIITDETKKSVLALWLIVGSQKAIIAGGGWIKTRQNL
jgi:hypothetical protein